jgi:aminoglycoside/choline kinase family phosphotransferase
LRLDRQQQKSLDDVHEQLIDSALEQPRVFVHRDYHSRNLMVLESGSPGIIDHQDAVSGPVTYDLVSLLRDCYIDWPQQQIDTWARGFFDQAVAAGTLSNVSFDSFQRWFDLMGIQRHLKAIGIFARLNCRDGKPGYLGDIPRTLRYVTEAATRHPETKALAGLVCELDIASRITA